MGNIHIIIQARMRSARLYGKVLLPLGNKPVLWHVVNRCKKAKLQDKIIVATSNKKTDDAIQEFCNNNDVPVFRGDEQNVLKRYYDTAHKFHSTNIVRITADCPLIDPNIIDLCIKTFQNNNCDYASNTLERTFPRGLDVEIFSFKTLEKAYQNAQNLYEQEHVTPYIWENKSNEFTVQNIIAPKEYHYPHIRLTLDTEKDYALLKIIYDTFYKGTPIENKNVLTFLQNHKEIRLINSAVKQKGYTT